MYNIFFAILVGLGILIVYYGIKNQKYIKVGGGVIIVAGSLFFMWFLGFHGELLWFEATGYSHRFWKVFLVRVGAMAGAGLFGFVATWLLTRSIFPRNPWGRWIPRFLGFLLGVRWGLTNWETVLKYFYGVDGGLSEPIYGKDVGFYLFFLPFYDSFQGVLIGLAGICVIAVFISLFLRIDLKNSQFSLISNGSSGETSEKSYFPLYLNIAVFMLLVAWGLYLERYHLMYSTLGAVSGPGWIDVNIRSWAYLLMSILTALSWLLVAIPPIRQRIKKLAGKIGIDRSRAHLAALAMLVLFLFGIHFITLSVLPSLLQRLRVEPNEITFEQPYIEHNIRFTRHGFNLHNVEERQFPASDVFTPQMIDNNQNLFSNIRLWDWRALDAVYKQFQEIRLYYEFQDVDIDRYTIDDKYRQVMVSAREINLDNLPEQSRTFVNERFKYTHGYGITLTPVNEFTPQGLPNLLIKDIPPVSEYPSLKVEQPRVYYGEATNSHVIVNSVEKEFDYPSGEKNVYTRYKGQGGVALRNLWRKFLYSWKFDGIRLLLSEYPTHESRIMFHRNIVDRVHTLAPFLELDNDPYIVLANGRLYWIMDAYTVSDRYPYSEPFLSDETERNHSRRLDRLFPGEEGVSSFDGINYIRNSVKCVVDAYEGTVDFYVFDEEDPLIGVWRKIFPEMFKSREKMPEFLLSHVRYPSEMLLIQGLVYAKYHMTDPEVFYNQEDLWIRATEKYYNRVIPVQPYYILWEAPDSDRLEFSLILPFTPKKRQVMIGWIAGLCDPDNYGRMITYKFPKEKRVLGPQQVETKIDQDSYLSGQLTLWDQRGSNVIRGNVLVIPVEDTLIYVEPIYLQAETAAYPELRLVAVMHNDVLSYAETFDQALRDLFVDQYQKRTPREKGGLTESDRSFETLINDANKAFETYLKSLGEKRYNEAAQSLDTLDKRLNELKKNNFSEVEKRPENGEGADFPQSPDTGDSSS